MRGRALAATALLGVNALAGCGGGEPTPPPPGRVVVVRAEVFAEDSALLVEHTLQLQLTAWDSAGRVVTPEAVTWWSGDTAKATVDPGGIVTARTGGDLSVWVRTAPNGVGDTLRLHIAVHGEVKWRFSLGGYGPNAGGPAEGPDGTIYVLAQTDAQAVNARLYAVTPKGVVKWQRDLTEVNGSNYPMVGVDGAVYVVGQYVWAFEPDGSLRWAITDRQVEILRNFPDWHAGAISSDGVLYAALAFEFYALRAANADTIWQAPRSSSASWLSPPTVSADSRTVYARQVTRELWALVAATGATKWTVADPDSPFKGFGVGSLLIPLRVLMVTGARVRELDTLGMVMVEGLDHAPGLSEPVIAPTGTIYLQDVHSFGLYAYAAVNQQLWRRASTNSRWPQYGGPALASGGVLYTATQDGFYALDVSSAGSTLRWRFPGNTRDSLTFTGAPLIGHDGTVYSFTSSIDPVAPVSDELFAFWEDKPVEPNSPWPMWRHDARRSGQASR